MVKQVKRKIIDEKVLEELESKLGYRREVIEVMAMRGIDTLEKASEFLHPFISNLTPWERYGGMAEARDRILAAKENGEKILIYGDYDCDGVCATSIMYLMLKSMEIDVDFHIPVRKTEGYGLNRETLEELALKIMPDLIITVDCGISGAEDIGYAMDELGIDFIVTDHHEPPAVTPDCIVIDPKLERRQDCFNELCGAGVVLRLVEALGGVNAMTYYIDLAALATIADVVPLIGDNRIIVNYGIDIINARARQSMKLLLDMTFPNEPNRIVTAVDAAYRIVPKINAVGRLADSGKSVQLFIDDDYFYAKALVESAIETNAERQRLTEEVFRDCMYKLEEYDMTKRAIVLSDPAWEGGVLGIVSARLAESFKRPAILFSERDGMLKGSGRSIDGVNLYECVKQSSMYLNSYGGHAMACGLTLFKDNLEDFKENFISVVESHDIALFEPTDIYDLDLAPDEFDVKLMDDISVLEPFGEGNPPVLYRIKAGDVKRAARSPHAKIELNPEGELIAFNAFNRLKAYNGLGEREYIATAASNVFQNRKYAHGTIVSAYLDTASAGYDERYLAARHAYQLLSGKDALFQVDRIEDEGIAALIEKSIYGTCFLCYNKDTYTAFIAKYGDKVLSDITSVNGVNPYNRVVLDMNPHENLKYYNAVVLMDKPMRYGLINDLLLNRNCRIYEYAGSEAGIARNLEILAANFPSVKRMREIYAIIRQIAAKSDVLSFSELYPLISEHVGLVEFYIAIYVFFELKLFTLGGGAIKADPNVRTSLIKSKIYRRLAKKLGIEIEE